jgi:hypothetical protein
LGSYTWSKSIDLSSGGRNHHGEQQFPQNAYCLQSERGLSNFNVAHRFVTSGVYEIPFGKGKTLLNRGGIVNGVVGGWQISSILALQTGTPNGRHLRNRCGQPATIPSSTAPTRPE